MTDLDDQPTGLVHDISEERPQSPLERLRAKREEIEAKRDVLIPIIGYDDLELRAKYRLLDRSEVDEIGKRVRKRTKDRGEFMYQVLVDTIILACEGFFVGDGADPPPLMNENETAPITTYIELANELKGEDFTNHRTAVAYVFGDNEFAVGQHGLLLNRWLGDTSVNIDEEMLAGE